MRQGCLGFYNFIMIYFQDATSEELSPLNCVLLRLLGNYLCRARKSSVKSLFVKSDTNDGCGAHAFHYCFRTNYPYFLVIFFFTNESGGGEALGFG